MFFNLETFDNLKKYLCFFKLQFKLIVENPEKPVASGLQVTAFVEYYPESEEDLKDRLLLLIEDDIVAIPLLGYDGQKFICCCYYLQFNLVESLLIIVTYGYVIDLSIALKRNRVSFLTKVRLGFFFSEQHTGKKLISVMSL